MVHCEAFEDYDFGRYINILLLQRYTNSTYQVGWKYVDSAGGMGQGRGATLHMLLNSSVLRLEEFKKKARCTFLGEREKLHRELR